LQNWEYTDVGLFADFVFFGLAALRVQSPLPSPIDFAPISAGRLAAESSTPFNPTPLTPRNPQENHTGQHFWPNLFLGRWLKGLSW
jgi:hypothetical protein